MTWCMTTLMMWTTLDTTTLPVPMVKKILICLSQNGTKTLTLSLNTTADALKHRDLVVLLGGIPPLVIIHIQYTVQPLASVLVMFHLSTRQAMRLGPKTWQSSIS